MNPVSVVMELNGLHCDVRVKSVLVEHDCATSEMRAWHAACLSFLSGSEVARSGTEWHGVAEWLGVARSGSEWLDSGFWKMQLRLLMISWVRRCSLRKEGFTAPTRNATDKVRLCFAATLRQRECVGASVTSACRLVCTVQE